MFMALRTVLSSDVVQTLSSPACGGVWHRLSVAATWDASAEPAGMLKVERTALRFGKGTLSARSCGRMGGSASAGKEIAMVLPGRSCASWKKMPVGAAKLAMHIPVQAPHTLMLGNAG